MNALSNVLYFLVDTLFSLYIALIMIRLLLGIARADFRNPVSHFIIAATNPVLKPLRALLPAFGKIDTAAIVAMLGLKVVQLGLLLLIRGQAPSLLPLIWYATLQLLELAVYVYIFALIIQAVISWVNPQALYGGNPVGSLLNSLTRPIVAPIARVVPPIGMVDISPLIAILLLNIVLIVIRSF